MICGLAEVTIVVRNLAKSEEFYTQALGLEVLDRDPEESWLSLRSGRNGIVLLEDPGALALQHIAFTCVGVDASAAAMGMRRRGLTVEGPVDYGSQLGSAIFLFDPDGHVIELRIVLPLFAGP